MTINNSDIDLLIANDYNNNNNNSQDNNNDNDNDNDDDGSLHQKLIDRRFFSSSIFLVILERNF